MADNPTYDALRQRVRALEAEVENLRLARTIHEQAERRVREAEDLALLGHWDLDLVSGALYWSDTIYTIFDIDPQRFGATYDAFLDAIHPDDRQHVNDTYTASVKDRSGYDIVHRLLLKDGTLKYVREKCKTHYDGQGDPVRSLGTVQDITAQMRARHSFAGIIGQEPCMVEMFETIKELTDLNVPVLIQGESGSGKELVANAIHDLGTRGGQPFVPVNCGALPEGLLESELFGHVRGAFTGAMRDKKGRFELAHNGTLFLDEVVDLPKPVQVKLLRVLQEGRFERLGGEKTQTVDVRIISASNRDLAQAVADGDFREDLFYRLKVVPIYVPALRQRRNDLPLLVEHFMELAAREGQYSDGISRDAMAVLVDYRWPGNVRELQSAIRYALIKSRGSTVQPGHLPREIIQESPTTAPAIVAAAAPASALGVKSGAGEGSARHPSASKLDPQAILRALEQAGGNKVKAARILGVGRATLYRHLKQVTEKQDTPGAAK